MAIQRTSVGKGVVGSERLVRSLRQGRYCFDNFSQEPLCWVKGSIIASTPTGPAGTDATQNCVFTGRHTFEYTFIGDNTDAFVPVLASEGGYNWGATTELLGRGLEINFGGLYAGHPRCYKSGTDEYFARILLNIEDVSGIDLVFGFRKNEDNTNVLTNYTDVFGIQILGDSSSGLAAVNIFNILNSGTDIVTASSENLTDLTSVELEVRVKGRTARFFFDGAELSPNTSYTVDSGDVVAPFMWMTDTTDLGGAVKVLAFECGLLDDKSEETLYTLAGATT
jgi:hypothetical protein